jgi:hypothetical protein
MALRLRSMTGVAVIPFGLTFPHGKLVAADSPLGRTDTFQRIVAEVPLMLWASTVNRVIFRGDVQNVFVPLSGDRKLA